MRRSPHILLFFCSPLSPSIVTNNWLLSNSCFITIIFVRSISLIQVTQPGPRLESLILFLPTLLHLPGNNKDVSIVNKSFLDPSSPAFQCLIWFWLLLFLLPGFYVVLSSQPLQSLFTSSLFYTEISGVVSNLSLWFHLCHPKHPYSLTKLIFEIHLHHVTLHKEPSMTLFIQVLTFTV